MIFDLVPFSHEVDLLKCRIEMLWNVIDKFVIFESNLSHTLKPKNLNFLDNCRVFENFKDKIIYITGKFNHSNPFYNDWEGRNRLFNVVSEQSDDSILYHSDLDELPRPEVLKDVIKNLNKPITFKTKYSMFCIDLYGRESVDGILLKRGWVNDSFHKYRDNRGNFHVKDYFTFIENAGWHYSFNAPIENILLKLEYFCHANEFLSEYRHKDYLINCIKQKKGIEVDSKPGSLIKLELNEENIPVYLLKNKEKYKEFFSDFYKNL